jgi:hypothetical protein
VEGKKLEKRKEIPMPKTKKTDKNVLVAADAERSPDISKVVIIGPHVVVLVLVTTGASVANSTGIIFANEDNTMPAPRDFLQGLSCCM